jgi:hypothetical protein
LASKISCTSCNRSSAKRARITAVVLRVPSALGFEYERYTRRFCAKSGCSTTSRSPPWLPTFTVGTPATGVGSSLPPRTMRSRPGRSVTSTSPLGRKAIAQGFTSESTTRTSRA